MGGEVGRYGLCPNLGRQSALRYTSPARAIGHKQPLKDLLKCGRWPVEMGYSITRCARSNPGCVILNRPIWDTIGIVRGSGEFRRAIAAGLASRPFRFHGKIDTLISSEILATLAHSRKFAIGSIASTRRTVAWLV